MAQTSGASMSVEAKPPPDATAHGAPETERDSRKVEDLRTDQPLPRQVLHKTALEQIFVTDWMLGPGDDWCTIAARLPLAHARFSEIAAPGMTTAAPTSPPMASSAIRTFCGMNVPET